MELRKITIFIIFFILVGTADATQLLKIRYHTYPTKTRIVLDFSDEVAYSTNPGSNSYEIILPECKNVSNRNRWSVNDLRVDFVEAKENPLELRVTLHFADRVILSELTLNEPYRMVFDVQNSVSLPEKLDDLTIIRKAQEEKKQILAGASSSQLKRIVIDPGHGGFDPGAVNKRLGLTEKEITLKLAMKLKALIEKNSNIKVFLTRNADYYVTLSDRTVTANQYQADLFISLHCNGFKDASARGIETFLSSRKASDAEAARVAELENAPAKDEPIFQKDNSVDIESILRSLHRHTFLKESRELAKKTLDGMLRRASFSNRGVKSANFFVLRHAQMPAILIEAGFITNYSEAKKLQKEDFQQKIARGIYEAIIK